MWTFYFVYSDRQVTVSSFQISLEMDVTKMPSPYQSRSQSSREVWDTENSEMTQDQDNTGLRFFSCRVGLGKELMVENTKFPVMFKLYGTLLKITSRECGGKEISIRKDLILADPSSTNTWINCFFQEIDRKLGDFQAGDMVAVTGVVRSGPEQLFQAFKVEAFKPDEVSSEDKKSRVYICSRQVFPFISRLESFAVRAIKGNQELEQTSM